jgi:hypothetical protein
MILFNLDMKGIAVSRGLRAEASGRHMYYLKCFQMKI